MLLRVKIPFSSQEKGSGKESNHKSTLGGYRHRNSNKKVGDGLRILIETAKKDSNNVLVKSSLRSQKSFPPNNYCFLQICHLCKMKLCPDKDVYMYRGEGFCSVECRDRQIFMDEMNELGASTKKVRASHRYYCAYGDPSETRALLKELQHRRKLLPSQKNRPIFSYG